MISATKTIPRVIGVLALTFFGIGSVSAAPNFFSPRSGAAFRSNSPLVTHYQGSVWNTDTQNNQQVWVSLGHAQGGQNGFTVYGGNSRNLNVSCAVTLHHDGGAVAGTFSGSTTNGPAFSLFIQTNQPAGNYLYSLSCILPPALISNPTGSTSGISGVKPDH